MRREGRDKYKQGKLRDEVIMLPEVTSDAACVLEGETHELVIRTSYMCTLMFVNTRRV